MSGPFSMNMSDTDRRQSFVRLALDLASIQKGEQDAPSASDVVGDAKLFEEYILNEDKRSPETVHASINTVVMPPTEFFAVGNPNAPLCYVTNKDNAKWLAGIINKHFSMED